MSEADSCGPQVDPREDLYRAVTVPDWWAKTADPPRVRSFAFKVDSPFSVNVGSLISWEGVLRHLREVLHCPRGGIVSFNCGAARSLGFDARKEPDPDYPDNEAHANVYYYGSRSSRKRAAKKLADRCDTKHRPSF
jgi:hypothetical protein